MADQSEIFINSLKLDLGQNGDGDILDVKLPTWASSVDDFLKKHKLALENPMVSSNLHHWIDLIFGINQNSIESDNVFHPSSYESNLNVDKIDEAFLTRINDFGQTPRQLFTDPHPAKGSLKNEESPGESNLMQLESMNTIQIDSAPTQ